MAETTWVLTKRADQTFAEEFLVTPERVGGPLKGYSIHKRRLHGGLADGVDVVTVDNGVLQFHVLPTRGMGIWKATVGGEPLGWQSPVCGPVHPCFVPLSDPSGLGWLDGFDEWLVRCGLESNGAPEFDDAGRLRYGLHGRIANKPAHHVEVRANGETGVITVVGIVDETRFHFFKLRMTTSITTRVGTTQLEIRDSVENLSDSPTDIQMLYHVNFGPPLLGPGAEVVAPVKNLVPRNGHSANGVAGWARYAAPQAGAQEQVYFFELQADERHGTSVLLKNAQGTRGVSMQFDTRQLPCFTLWKNTISEADGYVTGLEPATNYPNPRSFESREGRTVRLQPRARCTFDLVLQAHASADDVARAERGVKALQKLAPTVHPTPQPHWCPDA